MSKASQAWMPLYVGDYLGDTQRLTTEQHGAYLLLIIDYWRNGPPPDDDAILQQITKLDRPSWKRHRPALAKMFQITNEEWHHKRIDHELAAAEANAGRRSSKAKVAAEARWSNAKDGPKQSHKDAPSNATSMPGAMLGECPPPSPSPIAKATKVSPSPTRGPQREISEDMARVCNAAGMASPPGDMRRLGEWIAAGADVERDVLPIVERITGELRAKSDRPQSFRLFEPHVLAAVRARQDNDDADRQRYADIRKRYPGPSMNAPIGGYDEPAQGAAA